MKYHKNKSTRWEGQAGKFAEQKARFFRVTDYSQRLLFRLFALFLLLIIALIPLVKYLMLVYENREITLGQAAVFIVQTITTTGYGELLPFKSHSMVILSIFLMVSGVFMIFMIAGTLMATLIESRIVPRAPTVTKMSGHVVFTSYNETVARTIQLIERHNIPYIVAAEEQSEAVELIEKGLHCVCANPNYDDGLRRLNVCQARLVVASSDDTANINIALAISTMSKTPVLAVMENDKRAQLAYAAGAKQVVVLEETLGRQLVDWICADAIPTEFLKLIDIKMSPHILSQLKPSIIHIGSRSMFSDQSIGDAKIRTKTGATIAAIWHPDGTVTSPSADTKINDSTLIVLGLRDNVNRLVSYVGGTGPGKHVVLVGAGRVGQEAGKELNSAGIYPIAIDIMNRPLYFHGKLVVGDATKPHVLLKARIKEADTLIVTLDNDSLNIFTVLAGLHLNPHLNVVARAVQAEAVNRLRQAGANHVLSESLLGCQLLQVAMVEAGVLPKLYNYAIREVTWRYEPIQIQTLAEKHKGLIKIICIFKEDRIFEPTADYQLQKNDTMIVLGSPQHIERLL
jgi:voltage-gated potassium channel